jgi:hypothetical protein
MTTARPRRRLGPPAESRALVAGEAFDIDFRPESYWDDADPVAAILRNIKGERRRQIVADALQCGDEDIPDELVTSALPDDDRTQWGLAHPTFMGGEYLPNLARGATEIARIVLQSTLMDIFSLRARRVARGKHAGRLHFDLMDEYQSRYRLSPRHADGPLSLGEVIRLVDTARGNGEEYIHSNYVLNFCEWQWDRDRSAESAYDATRFVSVHSSVYPDLGRYYEALKREWSHAKGVLWAFDGTRWDVIRSATLGHADQEDDAGS